MSSCAEPPCVIPVETGIQIKIIIFHCLDPRLREDDSCFYAVGALDACCALSASFNPLPALNFGTVTAGI